MFRKGEEKGTALIILGVVGVVAVVALVLLFNSGALTGSVIAKSSSDKSLEMSSKDDGGGDDGDDDEPDPCVSDCKDTKKSCKKDCETDAKDCRSGCGKRDSSCRQSCEQDLKSCTTDCKDAFTDCKKDCICGGGGGQCQTTTCFGYASDCTAAGGTFIPNTNRECLTCNPQQGCVGDCEICGGGGGGGTCVNRCPGKLAYDPKCKSGTSCPAVNACVC